MKKLGVILVLIAAIAVGYQYYQRKNTPTKEETIQQQVSNDTDELQQKINELQDKVNEYKLKEQDEELRKIRLQQLQNPEIITNELSKVNELIIYKGSYTYNDFIKEGNWLANKSLDIKLIYNFGIGIDLNTVKVVKFADTVPVIQIPKSELKLTYIELNTEKSKIDGQRSFFSDQFVPEDVKGVIDLAQESVSKKIIDNRNVFDDSLTALKENIKQIVQKLNYDDVIFEEVN